MRPNGLHGANRLASNSLLEGLVMGARAADEASRIDDSFASVDVPDPVLLGAVMPRRELQNLMSRHVALSRTGAEMGEVLVKLQAAPVVELRGIADYGMPDSLVAEAVCAAAMARTESRGRTAGRTSRYGRRPSALDRFHLGRRRCAGARPAAAARGTHSRALAIRNVRSHSSLETISVSRVVKESLMTGACWSTAICSESERRSLGLASDGEWLLTCRLSDGHAGDHATDASMRPRQDRRAWLMWDDRSVHRVTSRDACPMYSHAGAPCLLFIAHGGMHYYGAPAQPGLHSVPSGEIDASDVGCRPARPTVGTRVRSRLNRRRRRRG